MPTLSERLFLRGHRVVLYYILDRGLDISVASGPLDGLSEDSYQYQKDNSEPWYSGWDQWQLIPVWNWPRGRNRVSDLLPRVHLDLTDIRKRNLNSDPKVLHYSYE